MWQIFPLNDSPKLALLTQIYTRKFSWHPCISAIVTGIYKALVSFCPFYTNCFCKLKNKCSVYSTKKWQKEEPWPLHKSWKVAWEHSCVSQNTILKDGFNMVVPYLSIVNTINVQPGSRKPYTKHFLMSTEGFFPCCYRIFTLSGMPQLGAAFKINQQYFFDICHTHFSTALSNNVFSWFIYLKSTSCAKDRVIIETWQFFGFVTLMKPGNMLRQAQAPIGKEMEWYSWIPSVL